MEYDMDKKMIISQKQRIYKLLTNGKINVSIIRYGFPIHDGLIPCSVYYNRNINEITEENHESFKNITIKFKIPSNLEIHKDSNGEYNQLKFLSVKEDGTINGCILNKIYKESCKLLDKSEEFNCKVTFDTESDSVIID